MNEAMAALDKAIAQLKVTGFDKDGNMVAKYGSPVIDGEIDKVWDEVDFVPATPSGSGSTDTSAKFKVLWDDKALYVLADVTDNALDTSSGIVYNRDCVEIFLDEGNNAKKISSILTIPITESAVIIGFCDRGIWTGYILQYLRRKILKER